MDSSMDAIEHVVVLMMENRSFDNLLGWLKDYARQKVGNWPSAILPAGGPDFDGLKADTYSNDLDGRTVFAGQGTTPWPPYRTVPVTGHYPPPIPDNDALTVPNPDPNEGFDNVTRQIFGTAGGPADMRGFLRDYNTANPTASDQIMQSYAPSQVPVISDLAVNFAVSDRWFASVPSQTWPNRGFVHAGSSAGHVNNDTPLFSPIPIAYDIPTIFNVLQDQGHRWMVFSDSTLVPSLVHVQFKPQLKQYADCFRTFQTFRTYCQAPADAPDSQKLPKYSFIEPVLFDLDPYENDYHPPTNVSAGERFLAQVYDCVRNCAYRDRILFVVLFDEHGGCYDHVPPPAGAAPPRPDPVAVNGFKFDRYGVRVPAIVVSSYVQAGTVFRAGADEAPFDHTSILATLRDWLRLDKDPPRPFLASPRVKNAPTLARVLTAGRPRDWPAIAVPDAPAGLSDDAPLSDLQKGLLAVAAQERAASARTRADAKRILGSRLLP